MYDTIDNPNNALNENPTRSAGKRAMLIAVILGTAAVIAFTAAKKWTSTNESLDLQDDFLGSEIKTVDDGGAFQNPCVKPCRVEFKTVKPKLQMRQKVHECIVDTCTPERDHHGANYCISWSKYEFKSSGLPKNEYPSFANSLFDSKPLCSSAPVAKWLCKFWAARPSRFLGGPGPCAVPRTGWKKVPFTDPCVAAEVSSCISLQQCRKDARKGACDGKKGRDAKTCIAETCGQSQKACERDAMKGVCKGKTGDDKTTCLAAACPPTLL